MLHVTVAVEPGVQSFHVGKRNAGDFHVRSAAGQHRVWHCCGQVSAVFSLLTPQEVRSQRFAPNKQTFIKIVVYTRVCVDNYAVNSSYILVFNQIFIIKVIKLRKLQ